MEVDTGLPSPMLRSGAPGETGTSDWARLSPAVRRSYLFSTYLGPNDVDALIRYAKIGGFGLIMLHRNSWRASAGHETIARAAFPAGLPDLVTDLREDPGRGPRRGVPPVRSVRLAQRRLRDAGARPAPLHAGRGAARRARRRRGHRARRSRSSRHCRARPHPACTPGTCCASATRSCAGASSVPGTPCRLVGCERGAAGTTASGPPGRHGRCGASCSAAGAGPGGSRQHPARGDGRRTWRAS